MLAQVPVSGDGWPAGHSDSGAALSAWGHRESGACLVSGSDSCSRSAGFWEGRGPFLGSWGCGLGMAQVTGDVLEGFLSRGPCMAPHPHGWGGRCAEALGTSLDVLPPPQDCTLCPTLRAPGLIPCLCRRPVSQACSAPGLDSSLLAWSPSVLRCRPGSLPGDAPLPTR